MDLKSNTSPVGPGVTEPELKRPRHIFSDRWERQLPGTFFSSIFRTHLSAIAFHGRAAKPRIIMPASNKTAICKAPSFTGPVLKEGAWALLLMMAVVMVYWPALHGGFVWDDDSHISDNPTLRSLKGLWDIWFQPGATCQYYPLSFTLFWAGYHFWGLSTLGYHLLTVLMHGLAAVLLWQVLKRLEVRAAWLAGAIFALHPVNVMSVAWMTELKNTLSGVLVLGAAWSYLRFAGLGVYGKTTAQPGIDWRFGLGSLALFQLAMFAKTAVSFLPATLVLLVWWKRERIVWRMVWPLLAMFGIAVGMGLLTLHVEHIHGASGDEFRMGLLERVLVSGRSFWFYLGKLFFPYPLTFIYERWKIDAGAWWQYVFPMATVGMLGGLWFLRKRIGKGPFVALLHFYITTSMLVLIQVLYMMRYSFVSDHWQYFGCMSVFALAAAGIAGALNRLRMWARPSGAIMITGLLLALAALSWRQCAMYADAETLLQTTIRRNPNCPMAYYNLGLVYFQQGRLDEAIVQYQKVLQINPVETDALNNLGSVFLQQGRLDKAVAHYQKALAINPDSAETHYDLANALFQQGRTDDAMAHYQKALAINPDSAMAHYNLGNAFLQQGRLDEAMAQYQKALTINPDYAEAHNNLGNVLIHQEQVDEAVAHFQKALAIKPDYADAHNNLGSAFLQQGRLDEAVAHYQKALAIKPDDADIHDHLGNALIQQGRTAEALSHYQKALAIKPDDPDLQNKLAWLLATSPQASLRNGNQAIELAQRANQLTGGDNPVTLCTLAAACAEAGQFPEAVATAQRALPLAEAQSNQALADDIRSELKLYQARTPFHTPEPTAAAHASP
ncbi:MAG: tetratricopeptide repeat protein [Verrucomicrobiota bacterium]